MRITFSILIISLLTLNFLSAQKWEVTEVSSLPKAVSNNAVVEGFIGNTPYVFSFGGLDETKKFSGIHLNSYRYNTVTKEVITIPDLPDTLGKVAAGASRIDDIIYIIGGYHVFSDGKELSSNKVHRYDIKNNKYLTDGAPIPVAIDDHVQVVWQNRLIYVITGWSDKTNVPNVQIYDPSADSWTVGTATPDNHEYKSFGASGAVVGNTIYYYGGAEYATQYPIQNKLRKGIIDPIDPSQITWSVSIPDREIVGYRMAATNIGNVIHWIGGSAVTYNYNGIAYNKSGGVPPINRAFSVSTYDDTKLNITSAPAPMDLRGIGSITTTVKYIIGGMLADQKVSNKIFRLDWK